MSQESIPEVIEEDEAELWRLDVEIALADISMIVGSVDWEIATPTELREQLDAELARIRRAYEALKAKIPKA